MIDYIFPFPPSVNSLYFQGKNHGQKFLSKKGKDFKAAVKALYPNEATLTGNLEVKIYLYPPDSRSRDLDNYVKSTLDALTHIGAIEDDVQIKVILAQIGSKVDKYNKGFVYVVLDGYYLDEWINQVPKSLERHISEMDEKYFINRTKIYNKRFPPNEVI